MTEPSWAVFSQSWDVLYVIAGGRSFEFRDTEIDIDASLSAKWDIKEAPGTDGASENYRGYTPAEGTVSWALWTLDHEFAWNELFDAMAPKPGKQRPGPIAVLHPQLAMVKLGQFVVKEVMAPKKTGPQILTVGLKLVQYFPQVKATPKAAVDKTAPNHAITGIPVADAIKPRIPAPPPKPSKGAGNTP